MTREHGKLRISRHAARAVVRAARAAVAVAPLLCLCACQGAKDGSTSADLPYAKEFPAMAYAASRPEGKLGRFAASVMSGDAALRYDPDRGYLDAVLAQLEIDPSSQVLVYSRTSVQGRLVTPQTPRAIYFNDDTYVAWIPSAPTFEVAGFDPELGPVFYKLSQDADGGETMERELGTCLRCHDTYGLSGGGVPRFLLGSGYTGTDGELVSHEAWILTSQATPLRNRWGGWYVTGRQGDQVHLGNMLVERAEDLKDLESLRVGNVDDLGDFFDTSRYPTPYSDIVALMVLEHQVEVQNLISRLRFETAGRAADSDTDTGGAELADAVEPLVEAMLMADETELTDRISGGSGFTERFESLGPFDSTGRSLRQLDLESRLFRYPLSYLIYSDAFQALPQVVKRTVYARLREILAEGPESDGFERLTAKDREEISGILRGTLPQVLRP
jgi:hypothetical protein